jgi:Uma2 family endonuclease
MSAYAGERRGTLSAEEFARLPEEGGYRIELVRGMMVREPQPGGRHGRLVMRLVRALDAHARATGVGEVLIEIGFMLSVEPATVRGPDVAFISAGRVPAEMPVGFWDGAPDLAVEVLSPGNRWSDIQAKVLEYLGAGAHAVWLVDPALSRVHVYESMNAARVLSGGDVLDAPELLPGFRLPLAELFSPA